MLQCVIRPRRGDEIKKTAEITGDRKSHLSSLSANLSQMQSEVNTFLTKLVEEEKAEKTNQPSGGRSGRTNSESGKGFCLATSCLQFYLCVCKNRHGRR